MHWGRCQDVNLGGSHLETGPQVAGPLALALTELSAGGRSLPLDVG